MAAMCQLLTKETSGKEKEKKYWLIDWKYCRKRDFSYYKVKLCAYLVIKHNNKNNNGNKIIIPNMQ